MDLCSVHTTSEELEDGSRGFTLKTHQMLSVHTRPEEFNNATIAGHFGFEFEENLVREITIIVTQSFWKSFVYKTFSVHTKTL